MSGETWRRRNNESRDTVDIIVLPDVIRQIIALDKGHRCKGAIIVG